MADFICEERASPRRQTRMPDGFVAEMRPSSRHMRPDTTFPAMSEDEETALKLKNNIPHDDQSFLTLLSNKSKEEVTNILTTSIIKFIHALLTGHDVATIEGAVQVSFHGADLPLQIKLNESYSLSNLRKINNSYLGMDESDLVLKGQKERSPSPESLEWGLDNCMFQSQLSPELHHRDEIASIGSSPPRADQTMNECAIDSVNSKSGEKTMTLNTPSRHSSVQESVSMSPESVEVGFFTSDCDKQSTNTRTEDILKTEVLDEEKASPKPGNGLESQVKISREIVCDKYETDSQSDVDKITSHEVSRTSFLLPKNQKPKKAPFFQGFSVPRPIRKALLRKEIFGASSSEDSETGIFLTSSDETDSDVPMDLSGDCKIIVGSSSVSEEKETLLKSPSASRNLKCKFCPQSFQDGISLSKHAFHTHQVYMCHHCSRTFTAKNNLKRHIRIHTGLRPYKCVQCSMTFARRDDLKGHLLRHDYNKPFRCSICKKGYTDRACVKNHMIKEHGSRIMYVCPQCGESFDREDIFSSHKKTHAELLQFACDVCPFIGSNNLMACKHSLVHTRKLFSCKPCNAYFADPFGYTDHVKKHKKNEQFTSYVCCFCDVTLPTYEQFVRHEYSHAHLKMHICGLCDKQFKSKALLQEHLQSHNSISNNASVCCEEKASTETKTQENQKPTQPPAECSDNSKIICMEAKDTENSNSSGARCDENVMDEEEIDNSQSNVQEQVLDLSFKKPAISAEISQHNTTAQSFNNGQAKISNAGVPRNGCVAEFSYPREGESAVGYIGELRHRFGSADVDVAERRHSHSPQSASEDVVLQPRSVQDGQNLSCPATTVTCTSPNENLPPTPNTCKRSSHQLKTHNRYTPYTVPPSAADLATKFILARCHTAYSHASAMKDLNNSQGPFVREQREVVLEKDSTGNPAISIVSRPINQANNSYSHNRLMEREDKGCLKPIPLQRKDPTHHQIPPPVVYGLTGAQYRKDSPVSDEGSNVTFKPVKFEPMDQCSFLTESDRIDNNISEKSLPLSARDSPNSPSIRTCDICCQTFESFSQLESHSVINHLRYMCEYCGKGFTSRPNRDRHVRYHTGERPYKCDLCNTAFHRGDDLKYHRTTRHPEATPFVCTRCSASFPWKRDLDRHIRRSKC